MPWRGERWSRRRDGETHLVVGEPHPTDQVRRHGQDISQHVDLKFVKVLVDRRVQQCFQFVKAFFDLVLGLGILQPAIVVPFTRWDRLEAQSFGRDREQAGLETADSLIDEIVDRVDDVVNQRLCGHQHRPSTTERSCCPSRTNGVYCKCSVSSAVAACDESTIFAGRIKDAGRCTEMAWTSDA